MIDSIWNILFYKIINSIKYIKLAQKVEWKVSKWQELDETSYVKHALGQPIKPLIARKTYLFRYQQKFWIQKN